MCSSPVSSSSLLPCGRSSSGLEHFAVRRGRDGGRVGGRDGGRKGREGGKKGER